jgi:hypothetical protein
VVSDSSCAYNEETRAANFASYGSYSTVSAGPVSPWGKGNSGDEESRPLMAMEAEAEEKVRFMNYQIVRD